MSREYQELVAGRLARRSEAFGRSPWTFIDQFMDKHPDLIYFGNGAPAPELYPIEHLQAGAISAWDKIDASALDYGELQGYPPLRSYIAQRMNAQGFAVSPDNILITFGSQQGIDIAARLTLDPGDHLAAEDPTYIGAMQAFDAYEPTYRLYPVDSEGFQVDAMIDDVRASGIAPKLIYVIPNYQNPTGQTMSSARSRSTHSIRSRTWVGVGRGRSVWRVLVRRSAARSASHTVGPGDLPWDVLQDDRSRAPRWLDGNSGSSDGSCTDGQGII